MAPLLASAQSGLPKAMQRIEIGYSFPMTTAKFTQHTSLIDIFAETNTDTTFSKNYSTKGGFGITVGTYFPIVRLGENSSLNIALSYVYNAMVWDASIVHFNGYDSSAGMFTYNSNLVISALTVHMGLPIGLDFKTGGESILDRSKRFSFTLGTGIYPSMNATVFENFTGSKTKLQPYLKGEVGVFAGVNFKVRALYTFGNLNYIDYKENVGGDIFAYESSAKLTSTSTFTLSIIAQPFSFGWGKSEWWR